MRTLEQQIKEFETLTELLEDLEREGITGYRRKRFIDQFLTMRARIKRKPITASFELTPLCNFDCKMCYVHLNSAQLDQEGEILSTREWIEIIDQAIEVGIMSADLTGGECLTHPGFIEIYEYLYSRGIRVAVLTNGQLLSEELIELFTQYPPACVQITIYGSCNEAYRKVTGRAAFSDVTCSIKRLKEANINVRLVVTPNRYMQDDVENLLAFLRGTGLRYDIGSASLPARSNTGREYQDFAMDTSAYVHMMKLEDDYRRRKAEPQGEPVPEYRFWIRGLENVRALPCSAGMAAFHINWKGEMTPCIPFYTIAHSVRNGKLMDAWQWIGERVGEYSVPNKCISCDNRDACRTCTAEKTSCILNGEVNSYVCDRLQKMIQSGLLKEASDGCEIEGGN